MAMSRAGKKRVLLAVGVLAVAGAGVGAYALRQVRLEQSMERWLADGLAAHERGEHQACIDALNRYVSRDQTNVEALIAFADSRRSVPMPNGLHLSHATSILRTALTHDPDSLPARAMLMELYERQGHWTEARETAAEVIGDDPANRRAHQILIEAMLQTGRPSDAAAAARAMAAAHPQDIDVQLDAFDYLARSGRDLSELEAFVDTLGGRFDESLALEVLRFEVARARWLQADRGTAESREANQLATDSLRAAAELEPRTIGEVRRFMRATDDVPILHRDAQMTLDRWLTESGLGEPLVVYAASRSWKRGDPVRTAELIGEHYPDLATAPDDALGWLALTKTPEADDAASLLAQRDTPMAAAWLAVRAAQQAIAAGNHLGAMEALEDARGFDRDSDEALLPTHVESVIRYGLGETAAAARSWELVLSIDPTWQISRVALARAYVDLGRLLEARARLLERPADRRGVLPLEIEIAIDQRGLDRNDPAAPDSYEIALNRLEAFPDVPELLVLAARAALATGRSAEAADLIDRTIREGDEASMDSLVQLAQETRATDPERAASLLEIADRQGVSFGGLLERARMVREREGAAAARAMLETAVAEAQGEDELVARAALGWFLDLAGDPEGADRLLALADDHPESRVAQETALQARGSWRDPDALAPVIQRLRSLTGESASQWRVYWAKRTLAMIDPEAPDADQRTSQVVIEVNEVLSRDPNNIDALDVAAEGSERLRNFRGAAEFRLRAVRLDPGDAARQFATVEALTRAGRLDQARSAARDFAGVPLPDLGDLRRRHALLERYGLAAEAERDLAALSARGDFRGRIRTAERLWAENATAEADAMIEELIASGVRSGEVTFDIADYYGTTGRAARGLELLEALPASAEGSPREELVARYLFRRVASADDAAALEARAADSDNAYVWSAVAQAYMVVDRFDDARRAIALGLRRVPRAPELIAIDRALKAAADGSPLRNIAFQQIALSLSTEPETQAVAELLDSRLAGRIDDAELLERLDAWNREPDAPRQVWQALSIAQASAGRHERARATLLAGLERFPADAIVARFAAARLVELGLNEDALVAAQRARELRETPTLESDATVARLLLSVERNAEALRVLEPWTATISADPGANAEAASLVAFALAINGRADEAHRMAWPLTETGPAGVDAYFRIHGALRDPAERRAWLERIGPALEGRGDPMSAYGLIIAWTQLAQDSRDPADASRALEIAERSLEGVAQPGVLSLLGAATAAESAGDNERAVGHLERALAIDPDDVNVLNNLAYVLTRLEARAEEAVGLATKAVGLAEQRGMPATFLRMLRDTQAQALLLAGRAEEAATIYERLVAESPAWTTAILGRAEALAAIGDPEGAREQIGRLPRTGLTLDQERRVGALRAVLAGG